MYRERYMCYLSIAYGELADGESAKPASPSHYGETCDCPPSPKSSPQATEIPSQYSCVICNFDCCARRCACVCV